MSELRARVLVRFLCCAALNCPCQLSFVGLLTSIKGNYTNTAMKMDTAGSYVIGLGSAGLLCILGAIAFLTVVIRTPYVHSACHLLQFDWSSA